jgi:hypothetical protein
MVAMESLNSRGVRISDGGRDTWKPDDDDAEGSI